MEDARRLGSLGEAIRTRRRELGWSQEELAERISGEGEVCRQSDVSRLERGKVGLPRRARLDRIAAALGLSVGELLAKSGWAGADLAFTSTRLPGATLPEESPVREGEWSLPRPVRNEERLVSTKRLRAAMEQAASTRRRTDDVLAQSAANLAMAGWRPSVRDALPETVVERDQGWVRTRGTAFAENEQVSRGQTGYLIGEGRDEEQGSGNSPASPTGTARS